MLIPTGEIVSDVERIAVLRANSIGDFIVALPALDALRAAYPGAAITYLGTDWHGPFLAGRPGPWDEVVCVPHYRGVRGDAGSTDSPEIAAFFAEQQLRGYDLAVQLHGGGANSNPFVSRLGARVTVGSRDTGAQPLDRWTPYVRYQHEVLRFLEVVGLVGAPPVTLEPRLHLTPRDVAEAARTLPPSSRLLAVLHPGANDARRRWPTASFAAVGDALAERGVDVVVVGAERERDLTGAVVATMTAPALDAGGRLSLGETAAVLARSAVMVGNDSGPRHVAAAVGTSTVGVFWVGNLVNVGPLTRRRHRVLVSFQMRCPTCGQEQDGSRCEHDESFVANVSVDDVRAQALDLLTDAVSTATGERTDVQSATRAERGVA